MPIIQAIAFFVMAIKRAICVNDSHLLYKIATVDAVLSKANWL
jgi:hypothetical protein